MYALCIMYQTNTGKDNNLFCAILELQNTYGRIYLLYNLIKSHYIA